VRNFSWTLSSLVLIGACAKIEEAPKAYKTFPVLESLVDISSSGLPAQAFLQEAQAPTACSQLELLSRRSAYGGVFRLYRSIGVERESGEIVAVQAPGENPQILYTLSREVNPAKKPIDPPTLTEFIELARQESESGVVAWGKIKLLDILNFFGAQSRLAGIRNDIVMARVEANIPGAFSGEPTALEGSALLEEIRKSVPEMKGRLNAVKAQSLRRLTRATPLFTSASSQGRYADMAQSLAILSRSSARDTVDEKLCRFALSQRLTAQILILKGVQGAPLVSAEGLLRPYPKRDVWVHPERSIGGNFEKALSAKDLEAKLASGQRIRGASSPDTAELMASLRTWLRVMGSHVSDNVWKGGAALNASLLKLGFAFFALEMPVFVAEELRLLENNRISLADDSLMNVLELGQLVLDGLWVAGRLATPNDVVSVLLSSAQIDAIASNAESSLRSQFTKLLAGLLIEVRVRTEIEGNGIASLQPRERRALEAFYRRAGTQIGNSMLTDRADAIRSQQ
jgi:hypothetical protein